MLHVAIVEDEPEMAEIIMGYLKKYGEENQIKIESVYFESGIRFLENYTPQFDIVLMDIQMPVLDGMQTAEELRILDKNVCLMFITNMAQFAIKGYEVDAVDFIVKPLNYFQFAVKIKRAIGVAQKNKRFVCIKTDKNMFALPVSHIHYVEVMKHTVIYHTADVDYEVKNTTMKQVEEELSKYGFARCNYCFLVNLQYVNQVGSTTVTVGTEELQISRNRRKGFISELTRYFGRIGKGKEREP